MLTKLLSLFPYQELQSSERSSDFIPAYEPLLDGHEEEYVLDAVRSTWISYAGEYCQRFETGFADFCGVKHAIVTCNGTVSLHLALHALGVGPGDEVILPALTFVATANAIHYTGATPIFADVDYETWTLDPTDVAHKVSSQTKVIIPVHLYGHPAPMAELEEIADTHDLILLEDAAQSHGASYDGRRTGSLSKIASFSLMANKIITTGEGGVLTTNDDALMERCRHLRDHAMPPERRYWHDEIGFNYRMTNLQAAIGVAQLERAESFILRKRQIAQLYDLQLAHLPGIQTPVERANCTNVYWMYSILVEDRYPLNRDELIIALRERSIDSRPFFHALDTLPSYRSERLCPTSQDLGLRGLSLPSAPTLTDEQILYICDVLRELPQ